MKCQKCQREVPENDSFTHRGETLCEDCYIDVMSPAKSCDPWAVYSATRTRETAGLSGAEGLNTLQQAIYKYIVDKGRVTPEGVMERPFCRAPVPDPLELQYIQPPVPLLPSLFGQVSPASRDIFCTLQPKFMSCFMPLSRPGCSREEFCRQSSHAAVLMPSHGRFVGASSIPFSEYKRKRGDRVGHLRSAVTDVVDHRSPGGVDDPPPVGGDQLHALAAHDHGRVRRLGGERESVVGVRSGHAQTPITCRTPGRTRCPRDRPSRSTRCRPPRRGR